MMIIGTFGCIYRSITSLRRHKWFHRNEKETLKRKPQKETADRKETAEKGNWERKLFKGNKGEEP